MVEWTRHFCIGEEMRIAIHQPNFFPWWPFFMKMKEVDLFIILTWCQWEKGGFQNRFFAKGRVHTMSVCRGLTPVCEKQYADPPGDWNRIKENLREYRQELALFDDCIMGSMLATNIQIIDRIARTLKIKAHIGIDFQTEKRNTARLVEICQRVGANEYLSGKSGADYLDMEQFKQAGIDVKFQDLSQVDTSPSIEILKHAA
jgi:hypothetical protein